MTSPSLPSFITPTTRRTYNRIQRKPRKRTFLERHGEAICFLWTCLLIAALIYCAFS